MRAVYSIVSQGWMRFSRRGRITLVLSGASLLALSAIDAIALYLLANAFNFSSQSESQGVLVNATAPMLVLIILLFACRSVLSAVVAWVSSRRLAAEQTRLGGENFDILINQQLQHLPAAETRETKYFNSVDRGPEILTLTMMNASTMFSEVFSIAILFGVFLIFDPLTALVALVYFGLVATTQHRILSNRSAKQGERVQRERNKVYQLLVDASQLSLLLSRDSRTSLNQKLERSLSRLTSAGALGQVLSYIPRYLLELTFVVGLGVIGVTALLFGGPTSASASMVLFAGISFRLLPVVNRVQSLALTLIAHAPLAEYALITALDRASRNTYPLDEPGLLFRLDNVSFRYSAAPETNALTGITLQIEKGKQYAVVGPSGAGKSTLANILLGIESPTEGVLMRSSDLQPVYVPQDTHLAFVSIAENVSLMWDKNLVDYQRVERSLVLAGLEHFSSRLSDKTPLTDSSLSGGEKQRIGLARAFYQGGNFLILDEVTSSLDATTEVGIVDTLAELRDRVTILIIAHRLSTVQHADEVIYLDSGRLGGVGSFASLASKVPAFRQQIEAGKINLLT
jgi:ABC-type multidrug transport system fused ATPase/permease subunit